MVDDLNAVPRPDFAAYYSQLSQQVDSGHLPDSLPDCLPFESSRGCWYGAKSQCKFCGLNGDAIAYRKKSPELVLTEIRDLAQRWQPKLISATDCIMPNGFGQDVLRSLEEEPLDMSIFYEVKASLRQEDLDQFVLSGVALLQPGIESLATNVLRQLAKGVSGIRNVWLLRECASRRLVVYWNILTAVPGEKSTDYEAMIELLPALIHLPPPSGFGDIRIDRFSPYHENAEAHGIRNLRPLPVYDVLYPESVKKDDIAYHFLGDYRTEFLDNESLQEDFRMLVRAWRAAWQGQNSPPYLFLQRLSPEHVLVRDSRPCASSEYFVVSEVQAEALVAFERPTRRERVPEAWSQPIQELLDRRYVVEHEGRYLSVVTDPARGVALRQRREAKIKGELSTSLQVDEVAASPQQTSRRRSADSAVCINPGGRNDGEIRV